MTTKIQKPEDSKNPKQLRSVSPVVDIYENETDSRVLIELPGVSQDAVQISVEQDVLSLSAERTHGVPEPLLYERGFTLPNTVERDKISAELKAGVLTLTLPRHEAARPKRIAVNAA